MIYGHALGKQDDDFIGCRMQEKNDKIMSTIRKTVILWGKKKSLGSFGKTRFCPFPLHI